MHLMVLTVVRRLGADSTGWIGRQKSIRVTEAVRLNCAECMGWQLAEIDRCVDKLCPLWPWRTAPTGRHRRFRTHRRHGRHRHHADDVHRTAARDGIAHARVPAVCGTSTGPLRHGHSRRGGGLQHRRAQHRVPIEVAVHRMFRFRSVPPE